MMLSELKALRDELQRLETRNLNRKFVFLGLYTFTGIALFFCVFNSLQAVLIGLGVLMIEILLDRAIFYLLGGKRLKAKRLQWEQQQKEYNRALIAKECATILKTVIVGHSTVKDTASAVARGVVGEMFLGTAAGVGAAMSAKDIKITTFLIVYKDGTRATKEVQDGSDWYNGYIKLLDV